MARSRNYSRPLPRKEGHPSCLGKSAAFPAPASKEPEELGLSEGGL